MTITTQSKGEIKANGHRTHGCCKPIMCIDTGMVYASITDAAEILHITPSNISEVISGRSKTAKGKRFCLLKDVMSRLDEITESIHAREAKANAYEEIERQKNALQNAEESVRKYEQTCSALREKLEKETEKLNAAKQELYALQANGGQTNNDT